LAANDLIIHELGEKKSFWKWFQLYC